MTLEIEVTGDDEQAAAEAVERVFSSADGGDTLAATLPAPGSEISSSPCHLMLRKQRHQQGNPAEIYDVKKVESTSGGR